MKPDEALNIPPKAGQLSIFVKTNTNYSILVQSKVPANEQEEEEVIENWLKAEKVGRDEATGEDEWHLAWEAQTKDYKRRIATVSITSVSYTHLRATRLGMISYAVFCLKKKKKNQYHE